MGTNVKRVKQHNQLEGRVKELGKELKQGQPKQKQSSSNDIY